MDLLYLLDFQFSLWDSIFIFALQTRPEKLSILFMRFVWPTEKGYYSFGKLSILFMRFNTLMLLLMYCFIWFFQFSLWDSQSILISISFPYLLLSILFMRFGTRNWTNNRKNSHFQFSLWDSKKSKKNYKQINLNFQFSLWDSCYITGKLFGLTTFNSLYEIHHQLVPFLIRIKTFNSLYEILISLAKEINKIVNFQFSLWDSHDFTRVLPFYWQNPFNSLYEILVQIIQVGVSNINFQFSLWDSKFTEFAFYLARRGSFQFSLWDSLNHM